MADQYVEPNARQSCALVDVAFTCDGAAHWLQRLLDGTAVRGGTGAELFQRATTEERPVPYGCGWFLESLDGAPVAHHGGHYDGWTAMAYLNLYSGCGVMALSNHAPGTTRVIRSLAIEALEQFAPGSTPLAQHAIEDTRPDLTATARSQLIRAGGGVDRDRFAPELQGAIDRAGPARGIVNLWAGEPPREFVLVQEKQLEAGVRMRRYRLEYEERVEHVSVGTTGADRIYWAWPL